MFQFFRRQDAAVRWFLGGLLVLICLTMVITLIPGATTPSDAADPTVVGKVGSDKVTSADVIQNFQQISQGNRLPAGFLAIYAPQILKNLMDEKALDYEAKRLGIQVTSEEVAVRLRANPGLFPGGQFIGAERYKEIVETKMGIPVEQFEETIRTEILRSKLRFMVTDAITVSDADADVEYHRQNDKVKVDYVLLDAPQFVNDVKVDDADLKAFFERTKDNFRITERRKVRYAVLDANKVRESVEVTPKDLQDAYERSRANFRVDERVQVSHIVAKTTDKTPDQVKEAEKKINDILARARKGEDFAALAKANSEDVATAAKGGDVGFIKKGQMLPEVEKVVWNLEPGKISDVIKTSYGFDIMKVTAHEQAHQRSLAEVQVELLQQVKTEKAERAEQQAADRLEQALRKNPKDLSALAVDQKLGYFEDPAHDRGAAFAGIGASPAADEAVQALKPGETTGLITVGQQKVIFQLVEVVPSRLPELSEIHDKVVADYKTAKSIELAQTRAAEFGELLKKTGDLRKAAKEKKYDVKTSADLAVSGNLEGFGNSKDFPSGAFKMKVGETAGPVTGRGSLFYQVNELKVASADDAGKNRETTRESLAQEKRSAFFGVYMAELRARLTKEGKMSTNEAALKRLTSSVAQ